MKEELTDKFLEDNYFRGYFPNKEDKTYCIYSRSIPHRFFKGLHITVGDEIGVYCNDRFYKNAVACVYKTKRTKSNLQNILKWLTR